MSNDPKLSAEEERMLDLALGRGSLPDADAGFGAEASAMRDFVLETRDCLGELDTMDAARLDLAKAQLSDACEDRVVASSRPGLFGDFALGFEFFKSRLKSNRALRIAAASLLVHLMALPVLAWLAFVKPEPGFINIRFEEAPVVMTEEPGDEVLESMDEDGPEVLDADLREPDSLDDVFKTRD